VESLTNLHTCLFGLLEPRELQYIRHIMAQKWPINQTPSYSAVAVPHRYIHRYVHIVRPALNFTWLQITSRFTEKDIIDRQYIIVVLHVLETTPLQ